MQYLSNACKILMLNEFEISAWGVWLDQYQLDDDLEFTVEDFIFYTAFFIKLNLNDEEHVEKMFVSYFNCYIKDFIDRFNDWIKEPKNTYEFDAVKVNKKFVALNAPYNPKDDAEYIDFNN